MAPITIYILILSTMISIPIIVWLLIYCLLQRDARINVVEMNDITLLRVNGANDMI